VKNILLVINPKAGGGVDSDFESRVKEHCEAQQVRCTVYWTTGNDDIQRISDLLSHDDFDTVFSAGGDGTFTLIAGLLDNKDVKAAIIPLGTSNGLASDLGIDSDPYDAFKKLLKSTHLIKLDQIVVNGERALYHIGDIGANANLIKKYEESGEDTYAGYAKHAVSQVLDEKGFQFKIQTADGKVIEGNAQMIAICNARRFGTKIALNQKSHPADGKFELIIFENIDFGTLIESGLNSIWDGFGQFSGDNKTVIQTTSAEIDISPKTIYQLDGEVIGETENLKIEIREAVIELVCQENCPY